MSEIRNGELGRVVAQVSDEDIDRAARSLVAGEPSSRFRASVLGRLREAQRPVPAFGRPPVFALGRRWLATSGAVAVLVLAVAAWLTLHPSAPDRLTGRRPATPPPAADTLRAPATPSPGATSPETTPGVVSSRRAATGAASHGRLAASLVRLAPVSLRAWGESRSGEETVDLFLDVAPLELPPIPRPAPVIISPVTVTPIEIPEISIAPVGDQADSKPGQGPTGTDDEKTPVRPPKQL